MKHVIPVLAIVATLAACTGLGELRERPPNISTVLRGNFERLAQCSADAAERSDGKVLVPTLRIDAAKGLARLFYLFPNTGDAAYEIAFYRQGDGGSTLVEGRSMPTLRGKLGTFENLWPLILRCAE